MRGDVSRFHREIQATALALLAVVASLAAAAQHHIEPTRSVRVLENAEVVRREPAETRRLPAATPPSPAPTATPVPIPAPRLGIEAIIAAAWPYDDRWALCTTSRESVRYTDFTGQAGEKGPWQIHPDHEESGLLRQLGLRWDEMPTDPNNWTEHQIKVNTAAAVYLYDHGGAGHWTARCW